MSNSFFNLFRSTLNSLGRPKNSGASQVEVGVFGKHPGWNDHIPDLGVNHPALIDFKRWLYDGITRNVDNGEWDKLKKSGQIKLFGHTILAVNGEYCIAARCWQSADGAGRDRYPMIAAALCPGLPVGWAVHDVVPALMVLERQCKSTQSSAEVERFLHAAESALRRIVPDEPGMPTVGGPNNNLFHYLAGRPEMGKDHQGLLRVLYEIERWVPSKTPAFKPFSLRVPSGGESIVAAAELWLRFLAANPNMPTPRCAIAPDHGWWLDLMVGAPQPQQLFCLCAPAEVVPFTTDVPYTLEPDFVERVHRFLENRTAHASAWP